MKAAIAPAAVAQAGVMATPSTRYDRAWDSQVFRFSPPNGGRDPKSRSANRSKHQVRCREGMLEVRRRHNLLPRACCCHRRACRTALAIAKLWTDEAGGRAGGSM